MAKWCFWPWNGRLSTPIKVDSLPGCSALVGDDLSATAIAKSLRNHPNHPSKWNIGMGMKFKNDAPIHQYERIFKDGGLPRSIGTNYMVYYRLSNVYWAGGALIVAKMNKRSSETFLTKNWQHWLLLHTDRRKLPITTRLRKDSIYISIRKVVLSFGHKTLLRTIHWLWSDRDGFFLISLVLITRTVDWLVRNHS